MLHMALEVLGDSTPAASPMESRVNEQINRILQSETFRHCEQLRVLLVYLTQKSLDGRADELKEYTIGVDAFGRPVVYDPRKDASVRIQVGRLRSKIQEYFRTEGAADPVVFELPKRGYRVVFHEREVIQPASALATDAPPPPPASRNWTRDVRILRLACLSLALAAAAASLGLCYTAYRRTSERRFASFVWSAELLQVWSPFLESRRPLI
jgi:hypothetical protein